MTSERWGSLLMLEIIFHSLLKSLHESTRDCVLIQMSSSLMFTKDCLECFSNAQMPRVRVCARKNYKNKYGGHASWCLRKQVKV